MSRENSPLEKLAAHKLATGAAVGSLAAAGAAGYAIYRKNKLLRERSLDGSQAAVYEEHLKIFEESRLPEYMRWTMARIAVHIFYCNEFGEPFVTQQSLREHFEFEHDEPISRHLFDHLAGYLKGEKIIGRQRGEAETARMHGYVSLPALEWGVLHSSDPHPMLDMAAEDFFQEITGSL
jgi:hypothetical protein